MSFKDLMTYKRILIRHIYTSVISWWSSRLSGWSRFHTAKPSSSRCRACRISSCDWSCQTCLASAALGLPCRAMACDPLPCASHSVVSSLLIVSRAGIALSCDLQKSEVCCLQASWRTPLPCASEPGRGSDCVVAIPTLVPCNRAGHCESHTINARSTWMFSIFHHLQKDKQRKQHHSLCEVR